MTTDASPARVAVASRSFSRHPQLRAELTARYPRARFNETGRTLSGAELVAFLRGHDRAITGLERLDDVTFAALPELRVVSKYGVGLDMIDLAAAASRGVAVRAAQGVNRQAVAELVIGFIIALLRGIVPSTAAFAAGRWEPSTGRQLSSSVVGIIGCGHIGQQVARLCRAFGATIVAHDIRRYDVAFADIGITAVSLDALLAEADIVTVHTPLDDSTRGLIGRDALRRMRASALLINAARGGIVDEDALYDALARGALAGAALDVFAAEPPGRHDLFTLPGVIGTPHIGGSTEDSILAMGRAAIAALDQD